MTSHRYEVWHSRNYIEIIPANGDSCIDGECFARVTSIGGARIAALKALSESALPQAARSEVAAAIRGIRAADVTTLGGCVLPLIDTTEPGDIPRLGVTRFTGLAGVALANHPLASGLKGQIQQLSHMHLTIAQAISRAVAQQVPREGVSDHAFPDVATADFLLKGAMAMLLASESLDEATALAFAAHQCQGHVAAIQKVIVDAKEEAAVRNNPVLPGDEISTPHPDMREWLAKHVGIELEE